MNDVELRKSGTTGFMSVCGGIALLGIDMVVHIPVAGIVLGGLMALLGLSGVLSKTTTDKKLGWIVLGFGVASLALPEFAATILAVGGVGFIGYGIYKSYRFIKELRSRA